MSKPHTLESLALSERCFCSKNCWKHPDGDRIAAFKHLGSVRFVAHGEDEEKCGGGGSGAAGGIERWESAGGEIDAGATRGERTQGRGGTVVKGGRKKRIKSS
jgi:hypothetical protein